MARSCDIISRILRYALWEDESMLDRALFESLSVEEWHDVHTLALRQGVVAIMLDGIMKADIPISRSAKMRFISSTDKLEKGYGLRVALADKLAETYRSEDIRMMILKGIGLSQLYPIPQHRPCSDIDIYLMGQQRKGDNLLRQKYGIKINEGHHHHTVFHLKGVLIENHYDFIEAHSRRSKARLEEYLKELSATEQPLTARLRKEEYLQPGPNLNALFLTLHAADHFAAENISIRHITDWAMFLRRYHSEVDWQRLYTLAEEFGFKQFLDILNSMCVIYIGMPKEYAPSITCDTALVERAWNDSMQYKLTRIPKNFITGWVYRLRRRYNNGWKRRMITSESALSTLLYSVFSHVIHPNMFRKN